MTLKPSHIREAIPELVPRIKFENLYTNFIESVREKSQILEANEVSKIVENVCPDFAKEGLVLNFDTGLEPIFDDECFNVASTSTSTGIVDILPSSIIPDATETVKSKIKTVQVELCLHR